MRTNGTRDLWAICLIFLISIANNACLRGFETLQPQRLSLDSLGGGSSGEAKTVLNKSCAECHRSGGIAARYSFVSPSGELLSDQQFIDSGWIVPGDVDASPIVNRLTLYNGTATSVRNMPMGRTLAQGDYQAIADWVESLGAPPAPPPPPPADGEPQVQPFVCNSSAARSNDTLRRLSKTELENTVRHLINVYFAELPTERTAILSAANVLLSNIPDENARYSKSDQTVDNVIVESHYNLAVGLAAQFTSNSTRLSRLVSAGCTSGACVRTAIQNFGRNVFRRVLDPTEVTRLETYYGTRSQNGFRDVFARMLASPNFLFHLHDSGASVVAGNLYNLSPYELASKLSYLIWQSMPDQQLFAAAADGSILSPTVLRAQVDRLFNDTRARALSESFFREWLHYTDLPYFETTRAAFIDFANGENIGEANQNHRQDMIDEMNELVQYFTWTVAGRFEDLMLSNISFARSSALAALYNVSAWNGDPTQLVRFPVGERAGILTRSAMLISGNESTNPVKRGVFVRDEILCDDLPPPPDNVDNPSEPAVITPNMTVRQRYTELTKSSECMACHANINPIGFVLENFDSLGRFRNPNVERIYDSSGNYLTSASVDSAAIARVTVDDASPVDGGLELSQRVVESGKGHACMARQYYRYALGRQDNLTADGCVLEALRQSLQNEGGSILGMLKALALHPNFSQRKTD